MLSRTVILALALSSSNLGVPVKAVSVSGFFKNKLNIPAISDVFGGHNSQLEGTVQQGSTGPQTLHPGLRARDLVSSQSIPLPINSRDVTDTLIDTLICVPVAGQPWFQGSLQGITTGITLLGETPTIAVPPHTCQQISCELAAAITLCNDNDDALNFTGADLGEHARNIVNGCATYPNKASFPTWGSVGGQILDNRNFNIIVANLPEGEACSDGD